MIGPSYSFVMPINSIEEYNDFVTHFPLSPLLRLSSTSTSLSSGDSDSSVQPDEENKTVKMLKRKWRTLVDGKIRSRGYKRINWDGDVMLTQMTDKKSARQNGGEQH